ncbi:M23 family metallopeptidase [Streptomyces sp. SBT349]|uniref:M23 family metallopeptidase n=1 Tax=Streptomyces sp. SBT349 TaxID=1580539 RepID=UPI00066B7DAD|nr:M23 family metallopeptidase [Streptomyces sp. SBT349]
MHPHHRIKSLALASRCLMAAFLVVLVAGFLVDFSSWWGWILIGGSLLTKAAALLMVRPSGTPPTVEVGPPVEGRWSALNSPADKTPSHGTHGYGQTFAIDIVAEPEDGARPAFGWWPPVRRSAAFPAFGAPLLAVADATVVTATDHRRDHLSRNSYPALAYLIAEGIVRDVAGPGGVVGNHVVLDLGGGVHALYAHLRRGSLTVRPGDRVTEGQRIALCGNSGNSSEPHVHFQLMDGPDPDTARGVPFSWRGIGVPANREAFSAPGTTVA